MLNAFFLTVVIFVSLPLASSKLYIYSSELYRMICILHVYCYVFMYTNKYILLHDWEGNMYRLNCERKE